jgi:hypothetical protein
MNVTHVHSSANDDEWRSLPMDLLFLFNFVAAERPRIEQQVSLRMQLFKGFLLDSILD